MQEIESIVYNSSMLETKKPKPVAKVAWLFGGFFSGALSWIPFFNNKSFNGVMKVKDYDFPEGATFGQKLCFNLKNKWTFLLGALLGGIFFFLLPIDYLSNNYPMIINFGLGFLAVGFILVELYQLYKYKDKKGDFLLALLGVAFAVAISFWTYILKIGNVDFTDSTTMVSMFFLLFVSTFFLTFSGQSIGTLVFLSSSYVGLSNFLSNIVRFYGIKENIKIILVLLLAVFAGYIIGFIFKYRFKRSQVFATGNRIGFLLSGIIILFAFEIKKPYYTDITTDLAQLFLIIAVPLALFFIAIALSIDSFNRLRKNIPLNIEVTVLPDEPTTLLGMLTFGLDTEAISQDQRKIEHKAEDAHR